MFSKRGQCVVVCLVCLFQHIQNCTGEKDGDNVNVKRQKDGDIFTFFTSNISDSSCEQRFGVSVLPYSKENCTVQCKCSATSTTYSTRLRRCASEKEVLNFENCSGPFLPSFGKPLFDLSKSGKAELEVRFPNIQSNSCCISSIEYLNGEKETYSVIDKVAGFHISSVVNGSALLTWNHQNSSFLYGSLLKVRLLCTLVTSQHKRSCFMIKTQERTVKRIEPTLKEHRWSRWIHDRCTQKPRKSTNVMLVYILVGVGCACVLIVSIVVFYACYRRRRRRLSRHAIPNSSQSSAGSRKAFKTRSSVAKNNGPTTPAIHDVIFNELSWDGDGGFSNRALADPRVLEVDYGIPIDFGTLPRQESSTSFDSNRNSLSPLTDPGENTQSR